MQSRAKPLAQSQTKLFAALLTACLLVCLGPSAAASRPDLVEVGRRLYEEGVTTSTQPLVGFTTGGAELAGPRAACARCHRRSGSGAFEGGNRISAITAPALFLPPDATTTYQPQLPRGSTVQPFRELQRPPYDSATLQRALREGLDAAGKPLQPLMPRYALAPDDLAALEAYLRQLSSVASPGVDGKNLKIAMALTPDASPTARQVATQVLTACLAERFPDTAPNGFHAKLQVWALKGAPDEWTRQLTEAQAAEPAYAMVSGVGAGHWAPVQNFCEAEQLPCLFPSVDVPGTRSPSRHTFYFSAGTVLEGEVMGQWIAAMPANGSHPSRVVAIHLAGDEAAAAGVSAMAKTLGPAVAVEDRSIATADTATLQRAMAKLGQGDVLALWLRARELQALNVLAPELPPLRAAIASGWLGGEALQATPAEWRKVLHFTWALDPPLRLERRMHVNLRPWLADKGLSVARAEERIAGDALTACNVFVESVARQKGPLTRDKLVEQVENYPVAMGNAMAPEAYHQFSLGPGQRFTSKGAFVVRFAGPDWHRLEPVGDWRVP